MQNCITCGTGRRWWRKKSGNILECPNCGGNPLKEDGRADWDKLQRARMVHQFGPRREGDVELLAKYREELG